ncbi:helix-turn-helix transcriptional regulator [Actinomycetospora sp. TBRC 11914]|uniref:ArsR/SmtB family transcription factor n=1 Tax=Actinomycetospora sp. TBRC 11914 TaxID=2729387 RepID=UPI00145D4F65|nr:winged helix-turn-helix domain-containing protein [Actinomycetospora sp. TBRC 11914]NMO92799.1 helix-turn-helix transcriptional regulator [Actinomycetospora sp. TBRC 11914]
MPPEPTDHGGSGDGEALAAAVFAALADPTRRAILADLAVHGPSTATDLAGRLPISRQAVTKHLDRLAETGLVTVEPGERRRIRHRVDSRPMRVAQRWLAALARDWDGPLAALSDHLDQTHHLDQEEP